MPRPKSTPIFPPWLDANPIPDDMQQQFRREFQHVLDVDDESLLNDLADLARSDRNRLAELEGELQDDMPKSATSELHQAEVLANAILDLANKMSALPDSIFRKFENSGAGLFTLGVEVSKLGFIFDTLIEKEKDNLCQHELWLKDVLTPRATRGPAPAGPGEDSPVVYFVANVFLRLVKNCQNISHRTLTRVLKFLVGQEYDREARQWVGDVSIHKNKYAGERMK